MFIPDPGSDFFPSWIPDPNCLHSGSRICKEFKYFNPQKPKKWFLSCRKYNPGCSSRIRMLTFYPSRIPESKRHLITDPQHCFHPICTIYNFDFEKDLAFIHIYTPMTIYKNVVNSCSRSVLDP
jgi:hypothetical protein